jgi:DNA-binding transcriptional LysR family regulator
VDGGYGVRLDRDAPLPLVVYSPPSIIRESTLETLERSGRQWHVAFTSTNVSGLSAAARAGIGLLPHFDRLMPSGLTILLPREGLPRLPEIQFAVTTAAHLNPVVEALKATIMNWAGLNGRKS